ncbi:MAG: hypothetical protein ACYTGQ_14335, partial [Planctomycetota bacterium]
QMLEDCKKSLGDQAIDYVFVSTHSQQLKEDEIQTLSSRGYRVEVTADDERETTSNDGLVFASSPRVEPVFAGFKPMGREDINNASANQLVDYLAAVKAARKSD